MHAAAAATKLRYSAPGKEQFDADMLQIPYKELLTAADKKPDDRQRAAKKLLVGDRFVSDFSREGRFDWY